MAERGREEDETHAVQRDPGRRAQGRDRRWPEARRPRHRDHRQGATQEQHLQGCHHPRGALAGSGLRGLRRRAPRVPPVQGNRQAVHGQFRRRRVRPLEDGHPPQERLRADRPGGQGRARQQGRRADDLHFPRRPLPGPDAQQPARRRRVAPHRGRGQERAARGDGPAPGARRHEPHRAHRRHRAQRRGAAVGPELPPAALGRHREGRRGGEGPLPDLPRVLPRRARHPRPLPARHRRDPGRHARHLRAGAVVHEHGDAGQREQGQALPRRHPALLALPDRAPDRERLPARCDAALRRRHRDRPHGGPGLGGREQRPRHPRPRHRADRVQHQPTKPPTKSRASCACATWAGSS